MTLFVAISEDNALTNVKIRKSDRVNTSFVPLQYIKNNIKRCLFLINCLFYEVLVGIPLSVSDI